LSEASARRLWLVVGVSASVQLALVALPDTMGDLLNYRLWARALARDGLFEAYWPSQPLTVSAERLDAPIDYPPVLPYLLLGIGWLDRVFGLSNARLDSLTRLPLVVASLALGLLLFYDARRRAGGDAAVMAAAAFLLNPGVVFDTAYWGQADALVAVFVVAALVALSAGRPEWSWASYAAAVLTKPLAYPFGPLLLLATIKRFGPRRTASCLAVFAASAFALVLPFVLSGHLGPLLRALFVQLDAMPYASVNAHNLWWLVERGTPWMPAQQQLLGPLTSEHIGLALLGAFYLVTLVRLWRSDGEAAERLAFASVAFGFFVLATHMHENHLFAAVPLIVLVGIECRRLRPFLLAVSAVFLANMLLHDPYLTHVFRPLAPGPRLLLPQQRGVDAGFFAYFEAQGYPHLVDQVQGETSLVGVLLTVLNAQAAVVVFVLWLLAFYGRRSFDEALAAPSPPNVARRLMPAVLLFVASTGALFLARAFHEDAASKAERPASSSSAPRQDEDSGSRADRRSARS
jgi:hypothetical protein